MKKNEGWDSLGGVMGKIKKSSVQLQHEAWDYIADKYVKKKQKISII